MLQGAKVSAIPGHTTIFHQFVRVRIKEISKAMHNCPFQLAIAVFFTQKVGNSENVSTSHDYVIKWKHFSRYWPFVRGKHRSPVNSPHKGQWRETLMFSLICAWINGWINNREAGDLNSHRALYDVIVMMMSCLRRIIYLYSLCFNKE